MKINNSKLMLIMAEVGITFSALSELSGVSRMTLSSIKNGKTCRPDLAGKIAKALNVPVMDIIESEVV
jgi:Predicted transcriptional regulators